MFTQAAFTVDLVLISEASYLFSIGWGLKNYKPCFVCTVLLYRQVENHNQWCSGKEKKPRGIMGSYITMRLQRLHGTVFPQNKFKRHDLNLNVKHFFVPQHFPESKHTF